MLLGVRHIFCDLNMAKIIYYLITSTFILSMYHHIGLRKNIMIMNYQVQCLYIFFTK